QLDVNNG
ncbi:hypothetical protein EC930056_1928, partial [Escherichia coli 93.0056]